LTSLSDVTFNSSPLNQEKTQNFKEAPLGLYLYPVLQAADILLYRTHRVPVGDDQTAHIFLTQSLAKRFNNRFGYLFPIPEQLTAVAGARIKSLRDPTKKMSKSDPDAKSRISLLDSDDQIRSKMKKAITDFDSKVSFESERRPAVSNLILLEHLLTDEPIEQIVRDCEPLTTAQYKQRLGEIIIEHVRPIRTEAERLLSNKGHLDQILDQGADRAREVATETMQQVRQRVGFC
jgi:tryptophanyl-tRNA synthetase